MARDTPLLWLPENKTIYFVPFGKWSLRWGPMRPWITLRPVSSFLSRIGKEGRHRHLSFHPHLDLIVVSLTARQRAWETCLCKSPLWVALAWKGECSENSYVSQSEVCSLAGHWISTHATLKGTQQERENTNQLELVYGEDISLCRYFSSRCRKERSTHPKMRRSELRFIKIQPEQTNPLLNS